MEVKIGCTYWHPAFGRVDVIAVYTETVTVRFDGRGISEGKRCTVRGVAKARLFPMRVRDDLQSN